MRDTHTHIGDAIFHVSMFPSSVDGGEKKDFRKPNIEASAAVCFYLKG